MISAKVNTAAGYVTGRIDPSLLTMLQAEAVKMQKTNFKGLDKYQKYLAGHLKHEYSLEHPSLVAEINKKIVECVELYHETFGSGLVEQEMKRGSNKSGMVIAMLLIGAVLVKDGNRRLDEKCAQEVLDGIAESHQECRNYYIQKKR